MQAPLQPAASAPWVPLAAAPPLLPRTAQCAARFLCLLRLRKLSACFTSGHDSSSFREVQAVLTPRTAQGASVLL